MKKISNNILTKYLLTLILKIKTNGCARLEKNIHKSKSSSC